jgi:outer membrane protein assembly factor BamB
MMRSPVPSGRLPRLTGRAVAALAATCAVLAGTACSATQAATGGAGPRSRTATAASPAATIAGCREGAWAADFTDAGRLAWQVSLPVNPGLAYGEPVSPLAVGGVSVFPDGTALYALRLSDGRGVWHREFGTAKNPAQGVVDGLWTWQGSVIAAFGTDSPVLVSLDPATGAVRWSVRVATEGLEDAPVITSDGVLAVLTQTGTLRAFDLATGRQLWSTKYAKAGLLAAGSVVIGNAGHGSNITDLTRALTAFDGRTGKIVWSAGGLPGGSQFVPAPGGRLLMYNVPVLRSPGKVQPKPGPLTALDAATGRTLWKLSTGRQVTAVWATPAVAVIATGIPGTVLVKDPAARLYLADLGTGKVRWSAPGHSDPYTTPVITAADVITVATTPATGTVTDHAASAGTLRWRAPITDVGGRFLAKPAGPDVLVTFPPAAAGKPSVLLAIDVATGATRATDRLPYTATVGAQPAVAGPDALVEPVTASCAVPVAPGMAPAGGVLGASNPTASNPTASNPTASY